MKDLLNRLINHELLSRDEAYQILHEIGEGKHNPTQVTAFLTVFLMRMISVDELAGFREALLDLCIKTDLSEYKAVDLCGTGGMEKIPLTFPHWLHS